MKILHICNGFTKQKLYNCFFSELSSFKINQTVYVPVYKNNSTIEYTFNNNLYNVYIAKILSIHHKFIFKNKIKKIFNSICSQYDIRKFNLIHSHTLYTNGAAAFEIYKAFNIPYIIAVRNTDINFFNKYMPYLKNYRDTILINAKAIILISPVYVLKLKTILSEKIWNQIKSKIAVIPNGIDKGYFINRVSHKKNYDSIIKIIYVGMFTRNKNIIRLMKAILKLNQEKNVSLTIVGDGGREQNRIEKLIKKNKYNFVNYIGYIKDINKLIELYRQHDIFAMVSFHETFGLVYIEALSQGLSIVYSAKEGVDGYFPENCNYAKKADPKSIDDICDAIKYIINSLKSNRSECLEKSSEFNWKKIAKRYIELYENF